MKHISQSMCLNHGDTKSISKPDKHNPGAGFHLC